MIHHDLSHKMIFAVLDVWFCIMFETVKFFFTFSEVYIKPGKQSSSKMSLLQSLLNAHISNNVTDWCCGCPSSHVLFPRWAVPFLSSSEVEVLSDGRLGSQMMAAATALWGRMQMTWLQALTYDVPTLQHNFHSTASITSKYEINITNLKSFICNN